VLNSLQRRYEAEAVELRSSLRRAATRVSLASRGRADFLRRVLVPLRTRIVEGTQLQYNGMQQGTFPAARREARRDRGRRELYVEELRDYWLARNELSRILAGAGSGAPQFSFEEAVR
jgi:hypothetical protein